MPLILRQPPPDSEIRFHLEFGFLYKNETYWCHGCLPADQPLQHRCHGDSQRELPKVAHCACNFPECTRVARRLAGEYAVPDSELFAVESSVRELTCRNSG